jgi:eukaryotic-like serine/threonine-protein kinase
MQRTDWSEVERIIDTCLELSREERDRYLESVCGGNPELRSEVDELLSAIDTSRGFFNSYQKAKTGIISHIKPDSESAVAETDYTGSIFGKYRAVKKIGSGGMGSVYLAERIDGSFDHKVAVKVIRKCQNESGTASYFKKEQQILASLTHEGIARLYDGGITTDGVSYLIMELIDGKPIDLYCDKHKLGLNQRIQLFLETCKAVQHAHSKLVIHRDLKAENILVTNTGSVKILDFGIATLQLSDESEEGGDQLPAFLTPKTTAPEYFNGSDITTATDVYSLGILLYQLVCGVHPFNFKNKSLDEVIEQIKTQHYVPAHRRFAQLGSKEQNAAAANRGTDIGRLNKVLKSDIDFIFQKAINTNSEDRYQSVTQLTADIENYLNGYPVTAAKNTSGYKAKKFIHRNRVSISVAASFLIIFLSLSLIYSVQLTRERDNANLQAQKAEEISSFLLGMFEYNHPEVSQGQSITAYEMLQRGHQRAANLDDQQLQASLLTTIGNAYSRLSEFETGQEVLSQAIEKNSAAFGKHSEEHADALYAMGLSHSDTHMWNLAKPYYREALAIYSSLLPENHPKVARSMSRVGMALRQLGEPDSALVYSETAYELMQANHSFRHPDLLQAMNEYAYVISATDPERAEDVFLDVIGRHIEAGNETDYRLASPYNNLAFLYRNMERYEEAAIYYRKSLAISSETLGDDHSYTNMVRTNLLTPLFYMGMHEEAEEILQFNIQVNTDRYTKNHWRTGSSYGAYGSYMMRLGRYNIAASKFKTRYDIYTDQLGADHLWTSAARGALAATHYFLGNEDQAKVLYESHIQLFEERYPDFMHTHRNQISNLIQFYEADEEEYADIIERYRQLLRTPESGSGSASL